MFRKACLLTALISFVPAICWGQIDLSWSNCVLPSSGEPLPTNEEVFSCGTKQVLKLHASFKVPFELPQAAQMSAYFDLQSETPGPLAPFWHYEVGGCNSSGIRLFHNRSESGGCTEHATPWGENGEFGFSFVTAYLPDYGRPGRGRLQVDVGRDFINHGHAHLKPLVNYYAFHLEFSTANASMCAGCSEPVAIVWNSAWIYSTDGDPTYLAGSDKGSNCVTLNHPSGALCGATSVRNVTWATIKSMYR
jgi:hypothetical protein